MSIEKKKEFIINIIYFSFIIALVYVAIKYVFVMLFPFIVGFAIAAILRPVIKIVARKLHLHSKAAAVMITLTFYGILGLVLSWLGIRLFTEIKEGVMELPGIYSTSIEPALNEAFKNIEALIAGLAPATVQTIQEVAVSLSNSLGSVVSNVSSAVVRGISSAISSVPGLFLGAVLSVISSLFFAVDHERITGYIIKKFPAKGKKFAVDIKQYTLDIGKKYVKGYALLMCITFIELAIGLSILNVDRAILIAAIIAVVDILPVLGTGGVVIPWILIELVNNNISFAIGLAVLYVIITVVRNILEPKIIGGQIGLHPLIMLMSMYIGTKVFGFIGLFALPIAVVAIKHAYDMGTLHTTFNTKFK